MKWVASLKKRKKKTDKIENVDDHLQGNEGINEPVYLNVYDISHLNTYFYWTGIGIYHSGVEVYGMEYAFAAHDCPTTGIFEVEPRKCPKFKFRKSIFMGMTNKNPIQINDLFENQSKNYKGNAYHLISNNCNHFTTDICDKLCLRPVPKWINRIARIVALCNCISPEDKNDRNLSSIPEDENDSEQLPAKTEEKEVIQYIPPSREELNRMYPELVGVVKQTIELDRIYAQNLRYLANQRNYRVECRVDAQLECFNKQEKIVDDDEEAYNIWKRNRSRSILS